MAQYDDYNDGYGDPYNNDEEERRRREEEEQQRRQVQPPAVEEVSQKGFVPPPSVASAWNREEFKNRSMSRSQDQTAADFIAQNQGFSQGVQLLPGSLDKVRLPTGEVMDLTINRNAQGQGTPGWTGIGHADTLGGPIRAYSGGGDPRLHDGIKDNARGGAIGGSIGGPASTVASLALTQQQQQDKALRDQLIAQLTQRAQQGLAVDRNTPVIRSQVDAYAANEERARRNYLADVAEQQGPLANLRGEERMAAERVGQRTGAFEAELMGRELMAKRQEIAQALESMRGMLDTGQEMSLRKELASMDDAIKRLQLEQQGEQFRADLGYRNRALGEQGRQYDLGLGFNYDQFDWARSPLNPQNFPRE